MASREWFAPEGSQKSKLVLYNSLVDKKVPFVPSGGPESKQISWYTCGPTVYDSAHMGHARNYVSFDIVRRVLEDYFGYHCLYVMNVTDVDDKIILRARRNYLMDLYKKENKSFQDILDEGLEAVRKALEKQIGKIEQLGSLLKQEEGAQNRDQRKINELGSLLEQEELKLKKHKDTEASLVQIQNSNSDGSQDNLLGICGDYIAEKLDGLKGKDVTDQSIFRAHAAKYEGEFLDDMKSLGCRLPDAFTRVSEYIPEIVEYIERTISGGFAYEANESVYFSTQCYRNAGHTYGKLQPWAVGSAALAAEGESNFETSEKRHPADFALWKKSKSGEPAWDSPWGKGRPGWHIECSAMASSVIGSTLDIHSGGEDLKFPHHDNELAQSEAYFHDQGCKQWVNYFLHSGHLSIEGLKMSKSLKNFITIKEALKTFTARQIRLLFVLQPWNRPMAYGESSREEVKAKESALKNFFQNINVAIRDKEPVSVNMHWGEAETELQHNMVTCQDLVESSLCDNINTRGAMDAMMDLIKTTNIYLAKKQESGLQPHPFLLSRIAGYLTKMLSVFGIVDAPADGNGLTAAEASNSDGHTYLDAFASFRDEIRSLARNKAESKDLLECCDRVRDSTLVNLGVRLEDRADGKSVWKLDDPEVLKAEIEEKEASAKAAAQRKLKSKIELKLKEKERFQKAFELPTKYSQYHSETGYPTHDKDGNVLEGKALENARKDFDKYLKKRQPMEQKLQENPNFLSDIDKEIQSMKATLGEDIVDQ